MKKVLILGAGMVVQPIVSHLLKHNFEVTVATRTRSKAQALVKGHPGGRAVEWNVEDEAGLDILIAAHDLSVSLLPWVHHPLVAKNCIKHKKSMITTSYVKQEMRSLDIPAKEAGIIILNELGLDPGIDHMSAMRIIDTVHNNGGRIEGFYSMCGALPAPEAADNPFRYKFSWSPKGVVMAANNEARFLRNGENVYVPAEDLFRNPLKLEFPPAGQLEIYPNRDSLPYIDIYGIPETKTMVRGTFRYPGWCEILHNMKRLGMLSGTTADFTGKTYSGFMAMMAGVPAEGNIKERAAHELGLVSSSLPLTAMEWLGLFESRPMNRQLAAPFEIVSDLMIDKMMLGHNERDMVAMQHIFLASWTDGTKEVIKSSLLDFGSPATETSVARTVALPAAIGVEMILDGSISSTGVHIPVVPEIYNPILDRLELLGIHVSEEYGIPEKEFAISEAG